MRYKTILAIGLFLLTAQTQAGFCELPTHIFYFQAGGALPVGPDIFSKYRKLGLVTGVAVGFPRSEQLTVVVGLDHAKHFLDKQAVIDETGLKVGDVTGVGGEAVWWTVTVGLKAQKLRPEGRFNPYLRGDLAFVKFRGEKLPPHVTSDTLDPNDVEIDQKAPGVVLGGGVEMDVGERVGVYLEGRYVIGIKGGATTQFMPLMVGVSVR